VARDYEVWERDDPRYPAAFQDLSNPPRRLWALGDPRVLERAQIAVVGTRHPTLYGARVARQLGYVLAKAGACVVSGLAAGIDAAAHDGALDADGRTCAVLGTGIDVTYPAANRSLQERISDVGLLLSEYAPGQPAAPWTFPQRNRLIAALGRATIVVEAGKKSGALITAAIAGDLGRTVAAVPGPIDAVQAEGSNNLIRDGAAVIAAMDDAPLLIGARVVALTAPPDLEVNEAKVWEVLAEAAGDIDFVAMKSHLPVAHCMTALTNLELAGMVASDLTGTFRRA
jgi:DNA processing protein